jgi:hypothetical protein
MRLSRGDLFKFKGGYGVVISDTKAFLISGEEDLTGYTSQVAEVPKDAFLANRDEMPFTVGFALEAVAVVTAHEQPLN